jgi:uncharacterized Zn finger protein (UPF0148 family)
MLDSTALTFVIPTIVLCVMAVPLAVLVQRRPRSQAFCVKERVKREIIGAHTVVLKNGRKALQGKCKSCGTTLFRMKSSRNLAVIAPKEWRAITRAWLRRVLRPQAYCMKERVKREIIGAHTVVLKNGRKALQGKCKSCGTALFRMKSNRNLAVIAPKEWRAISSAWLRRVLRPQAYCMKERVKREIIGAHTVVLKNGRKALQGKCKSCGTALFRMK